MYYLQFWDNCTIRGTGYRGNETFSCAEQKNNLYKCDEKQGLN